MTVKDTNPKTAFGIRNWQRELMLRTSNANRQSCRGFQWPESGAVEAPDWDPYPVCGGGLHGAARGEGDGLLFDWSADSVWQVVEYDPAEAVDLKGKIKIPRGVVVYSGNREDATRIIQERYPGAAVIGGTATAGGHGAATVGDYGTATVGDYGAATAGDRGTATAGDRGTATAGDRGTAAAGECGAATAGECGAATAGYYGTAVAGGEGTATVGDYGTATVGDGGIATAGYYGTAVAGGEGTAVVGDEGIAMAGVYGAAAAGNYGIIQIAYLRGERRRILTGYVGENGLRPRVRYRVEGGKFVEVDSE